MEAEGEEGELFLGSVESGEAADAPVWDCLGLAELLFLGLLGFFLVGALIEVATLVTSTSCSGRTG